MKVETKTEERICKKCKGIINLNEHDYYISKYGQRKSYYCSDDCIRWGMEDKYNTDYSRMKDLLDRFIKSDYIKVTN